MNELKHSDFGVVARYFCPPFECTLAAGAVQRFLLQNDVLASSLEGHSETGWQTPRVRLQTHRCVSGNYAPVGALCGDSSKAAGLCTFGAVRQRSELHEEAAGRLDSDRRAGSICAELLHHGCIPGTTLPPRQAPCTHMLPKTFWIWQRYIDVRAHANRGAHEVSEAYQGCGSRL